MLALEVANGSLYHEAEAEENEQESAMPPNLKFCPATPSPSSALPLTLPVTTTRTRPAMDRLTRDYTDPLLTDQPDTSRQSAAVQPRRPFSPLVKRRRQSPPPPPPTSPSSPPLRARTVRRNATVTGQAHCRTAYWPDGGHGCASTSRHLHPPRRHAWCGRRRVLVNLKLRCGALCCHAMHRLVPHDRTSVRTRPAVAAHHTTATHPSSQEI